MFWPFYVCFGTTLDAIIDPLAVGFGCPDTFSAIGPLERNVRTLGTILRFRFQRSFCCTNLLSYSKIAHDKHFVVIMVLPAQGSLHGLPTPPRIPPQILAPGDNRGRSSQFFAKYCHFATPQYSDHPSLPNPLCSMLVILRASLLAVVDPSRG